MTSQFKLTSLLMFILCALLPGIYGVTITTAPSSGQFTTGSQVHISCLYSSQYTFDSFVHPLYGSMQSSNDDYLIQNLNNIVTFAFVQAEEIDTGTYFCTFDAVSGDGRAYALTKLIFVPSVSFVNQVTSFIGLVGESVTLTCTPQHASANGIQWMRNHRVLNSRFDRVTVVGGVLTINPAQLGDSGLYICTAGNAVSLNYVDTYLDIAHPTVSTTQLVVTTSQEVPPEIQTQPVNATTILERQPFNLSCTASGNPPPIINWVREDGSDLNTMATINTQSNPTLPLAFVTSTLSVPSALYSDSGRYQCSADNNISNQVFSDFSEMTVRLICPGLPPIDNGILEYDTIEDLLNATRTNGTVATYTCNDGFSLDRNSSRICDTRKWTETEPMCIKHPTVFTTQSVVATSQGGVSNSVIISTTVVIVVALLAIVCSVCVKRLRGNKAEMRRVSTTIRMRKLSDRSSLMDYQMREIVKYVPESMRIPSSNLKLQDTVGQGAFGIVYKGLLMDWNNVAIRGVALKTLKGLFTQSDVQSMVSEITKMQEFHHPHVMPLIGVCLDAGPGVFMVMPYMTNGSLLDYLKKERCNLDLTKGEDSDKVFSVRKLLLKMCYQIALGMAYLAQHKFVHRDLAARNCMLHSNGDLKVGDFGLAEDVYSTGYFRQSDSERVKLPYKWLAMESLNDAIFNEKTDVWSYGVTVWEVFSGGRTPYPGIDAMSLVALLREGRRLEPPQNIACSTEMVSLMARCWYKNSKERPSFKELADELDGALTIIVGYVELNMELQIATTEKELECNYILSPKGQIKLAEASTEEVATETNAAYELRAKDLLQNEQVLVETNVTYGMRRDLELNTELVVLTENEPDH